MAETRGEFISGTVDVIASSMMAFVVTKHLDAYREWVRTHPDVLPDYIPLYEDADFWIGAAEAFTRICLGEDPETMR